MRLLVLAWEFPPRIIGGISRHVAELYPELVRRHHEVHLLTVSPTHEAEETVIDGIAVYRLPVPESADFFAWVRQMNHLMEQKGRNLCTIPMDVIHAHDWLVATAAIALAETYATPLVATIHATEYGRNNGIHNDSQRYIHQHEVALTQAAQRVIVCSQYMQGEVARAFHCPATKTRVIFNGIRPNRVTRSHLPEQDLAQWRRTFAEPEEAIVYYVGRLTYEKGIFVLLNAAPLVLRAMGDRVKFVIIGTGDSYAVHLRQQAWNLGIFHKVVFTGFMKDEDVGKMRQVADCAVFPSLYEPFGIVALECYAAEVPLVVSDTGGLPEVVHHGETGIVTRVHDHQSLAAGILAVLGDPVQAQQRVRAARQLLDQHFRWDRIALHTEQVYDEICTSVPCPSP
jgi:glycosyltransferase involved in cell wall biosynthesis